MSDTEFDVVIAATLIPLTWPRRRPATTSDARAWRKAAASASTTARGPTSSKRLWRVPSRNSVAQVDGDGAKELRGALAEGQADMGA